MKNFLAAWFIVSSFFLFTSCEKKKGSGIQKVRISSTQDPLSFDPLIAADMQSQTFQRLLFEGLMRYTGEGNNIEPAIAESYEISSDKKTYRFYLKDTDWSNGEKLTAHHFAYAWKKILRPDFPSSYGYAFYVIQNAKNAKEGKCSIDEIGIHVIDDYTLEINLNHPAPYFLEMVACPLYFPSIEENISFFSPKRKGSSLISNGPFFLSEWKPKSQTIVKKNTLYWDQKNVALDELEIAIIPEELTSLSLFEDKDLDFIGNPLILIPKDAHLELKKKNLLHCNCAPFSSWYLLQVTDPLMQNVHLRKALAFAINRVEIAENILHAGESPAMSILPKNLQVRKRRYYPFFDPEKAKKHFELALQELGYTRKNFPKLKISGAHKHLLMAEIIQNQWKTHLGIDSEIDLCEWNVFLEKVGKRDYQIAAMGWLSWLNDPI